MDVKCDFLFIKPNLQISENRIENYLRLDDVEYYVSYLSSDFKSNKGYGTKMHMDAIWKMGPTKIHRKTYYPVSAYLVKDRQLSIDFDNDDNYDDEEN